MTILYADRHIICDDESITIHWYYFPLGISKKLTYSQIKGVKEEELNLLQGKLRLWGMDLTPYWFHLDLVRPSKSKFIILDDGEWIKPAITPENHHKVLEILQEKILV
jgi:hypothetical protein